jgi:hypothetical protein
VFEHRRRAEATKVEVEVGVDGDEIADFDAGGAPSFVQPRIDARLVGMRRISEHCAIAVGSLPANEAEEASQRSRAAVASTDGISAFLLRMVQKGAHARRGQPI